MKGPLYTIEQVVSNLRLCVPHYLMSCYLYYEKGCAVFTDEEFDMLCRTIFKNYDRIEHPHLHLITKASLRCGTGFSIKEYPTIVKNCANDWYNDFVESQRVVEKPKKKILRGRRTR